MLTGERPVYDQAGQIGRAETLDELYACIYTSIATREMTKDDLIRIAASARRNNASKGVTGMLVYKDRHFMQILEGPEAVVRDTFEKISTDGRHSRMIELAWHKIAHRAFERWWMEMADLSDPALARILEPDEIEASFRSGTGCANSHSVERLFAKLRSLM